MRGNITLTVMVGILMMGLTFAPTVLAEDAWNEDGWLTTNLADNRLELGDEFGCYGIPGLEWSIDPGAVASECRKYIEERLPASKWSDSPISIYTPDYVPMSGHNKIASQGFTVHGDMNGLDDYTAWHSSDDRPVYEEDWFNLGRRGGSLESGIGSLAELQDQVDSGGLVNMYWIGRNDQASIRADSEIVNWLEYEAEVWLTTWGEAWSYWAISRCYEFGHSLENNTTIEFILESTIACNAANPEVFDIPTTWVIDVDNKSISRVSINGENVSDMGLKKNLQNGWRVEDGLLYLSVQHNLSVEIVLEEEPDNYDIIGQTEFFNGFESAVTIAGHNTRDLFLWSRKFVDESNLSFTWLLTPQKLEEKGLLLPMIGVSIGAVTILGMFYLLKTDSRRITQESDFYERLTPKTNISTEPDEVGD